MPTALVTPMRPRSQLRSPLSIQHCDAQRAVPLAQPYGFMIDAGGSKCGPTPSQPGYTQTSSAQTLGPASKTQWPAVSIVSASLMVPEHTENDPPKFITTLTFMRQGCVAREATLISLMEPLIPWGSISGSPPPSAPA